MGYVYLMKPVSNNVYKIGETINIEERIIVLQRKFDFELECIDFIEVDEIWQFYVERKLHLKLWRYHLGGDWFALPDELANQFTTMANQIIRDQGR